MMGYTRIADNPDSWEGFHWGTPHTYGYYWRLGGPEPFDMLDDGHAEHRDHDYAGPTTRTPPAAATPLRSPPCGAGG